MQFSIALSDLEHLTGLSGLTDQSGAALDARLREAFAFLPEDSEFSVDDQGVLHVNAPSAPEDAKSTAERHAQKAARSASKGDYAKARKLFNQALSLDPALTHARRDLAMLCSEIGDHEAAKDHLIDVLRTTPDDAWAYVILANHYARVEDNAEMANTLLRRAVEIAPEDPYAHNCPIDMRIERTIRAEYPTLKQAQFCGVAQMAHEAQQASFSEKVRTAFPAPMLRLNDALNTAFALFVDDLFERATAFSEAYRPLPDYREGQKLYQLWQELDANTPVGEEWRMIAKSSVSPTHLPPRRSWPT